MMTFGQKIVKVMKDCSHVAKDGKNDHQNYAYSSAVKVLESVNRSLCENGLYSSSQIDVITDEMISGGNNGPRRFCQIKMKLTIHDVDSDKSMTVESLGSSLNNGDKGVAIAQTMALKYAWRNALQIAFGNDEPDATENTEIFEGNKIPQPAQYEPKNLTRAQMDYPHILSLIHSKLVKQRESIRNVLQKQKACGVNSMMI